MPGQGIIAWKSLPIFPSASSSASSPPTSSSRARQRNAAACTTKSPSRSPLNQPKFSIAPKPLTLIGEVFQSGISGEKNRALYSRSAGRYVGMPSIRVKAKGGENLGDEESSKEEKEVSAASILTSGTRALVPDVCPDTSVHRLRAVPSPFPTDMSLKTLGRGLECRNGWAGACHGVNGLRLGDPVIAVSRAPAFRMIQNLPHEFGMHGVPRPIGNQVTDEGHSEK